MYWTLKKKDYDKITEIEGKTRSIAGLATAALNHLNNSTFKKDSNKSKWEYSGYGIAFDGKRL